MGDSDSYHSTSGGNTEYFSANALTDYVASSPDSKTELSTLDEALADHLKRVDHLSLDADVGLPTRHVSCGTTRGDADCDDISPLESSNPDLRSVEDPELGAAALAEVAGSDDPQGNPVDRLLAQFERRISERGPSVPTEAAATAKVAVAAEVPVSDDPVLRLIEQFERRRSGTSSDLSFDSRELLPLHPAQLVAPDVPSAEEALALTTTELPPGNDAPPRRNGSAHGRAPVCVCTGGVAGRTLHEMLEQWKHDCELVTAVATE